MSDERPNHQPGGNHQHHGQCDLGHDQRVSGALAARSIARRSAAFFERRGVRPAESQNRHEAEQQADDDREGEREEQHQRVDADLVETRQLRWRHRSQEANRGVGQHQAERAAAKRQQQTLRQQHARDAAAAGAERGTQRQLLLASLGPDEKQVCHVCAGDEQHERDGRKENPEHASRRCRWRTRRAGGRTARASVS